MDQNQLENSILFPALFQGGSSLFTSKTVSGLQLWLRGDKGTFQDSAKTTAAVSDADVIGAWADQSGNGNDALQSTTSAKPTLRLSVLNNLPVIRFDGVNDAITSTSVSLAGFTIFILFRASDGTFVYEHSPNTDTTPGSFLLTTSGETMEVNRGGVISSKNLSAGWAEDNTWRISMHRYDGTQVGHQIWLDGSQQAAVNGIVNDPGIATVSDEFNIASRNGISGEMGGDIAEIMVYNSAISNSDRQTVESYLNRRYVIF